MVKILVEIRDDLSRNISFSIEEENPTDAEMIWEGRLCAVLKNALNTAVALLEERTEKP